MPMLLDIRDTVADYAELIARVVGVDVEVVDAGLNRLAGTGLYASGVGENIRAEGETYRHVMRIRRSFVMETPREHFICTRCPGRDLCRETLSISTPIIDGSDVLGVIGLVCSTDEDRARVLGHKDVYVQFIDCLLYTSKTGRPPLRRSPTPCSTPSVSRCSAASSACSVPMPRSN